MAIQKLPPARCPHGYPARPVPVEDAVLGPGALQDVVEGCPTCKVAGLPYRDESQREPALESPT